MFLKAGTIVLLSGAISTCADFVDEDRIEIETGPSITRTIEAQDFDRLAINGSYDVIVVPGETAAIEMVGPENIVNKTRFDFEDGLLTISPRDNDGLIIRWADGSKTEIRITSPGIRETTILGSSDVRMEAYEGEDFLATIKGSGDLNVGKLAAGTAAFEIQGSGDVYAAGTAERLDVAVAGSGDLALRDLAATTADIAIAGSGDVVANVSDEADVSIAGSGDVVVDGGATCNISKAGSGDAVCRS